MQRVAKWQLLLTYVPSISVLLAVIILSLQAETDFRRVIVEGGFLSDLGIILWCISASVCWFAYTTLRIRKPVSDSSFIFYSALLSSYLFFDDFFQLHELHIPYYLGISEKFVLLALVIFTIYYLVVFRHVILETNHVVLFLALFFFAASIGSDGIFSPLEVTFGMLVILSVATVFLIIYKPSIVFEFSGIIFMIYALCTGFIFIQSKIDYSEYLLEDGIKWLGIASWTSYYINTSYQIIKEALVIEQASPRTN